MSSTVQYILVRTDLKWPTGALLAQACHAVAAVIHLYYNDPHTQDYLKDLDNMHKIVLQVNGEDDLRKVHETLTSSSIDHKMWIEQPENIPTCIALKPYPKTDVQSYFKKFKLFKD